MEVAIPLLPLLVVKVTQEEMQLHNQDFLLEAAAALEVLEETHQAVQVAMVEWELTRILLGHQQPLLEILVIMLVVVLVNLGTAVQTAHQVLVEAVPQEHQAAAALVVQEQQTLAAAQVEET
jgi:hypothetical protein